MKIFNTKFIIIIITVIIAIIVITLRNPPAKNTSNQSNPTPITQVQQNEKPKIVSTKPEPLENAIISASEVIEITFNRPLENVGEFKVRIDPKVDFKVDLSGNRKTAKIIPAKPYELGTTYTLFIGTETKFDGIGRWGEDKIFHFRTIKYRGV